MTAHVLHKPLDLAQVLAPFGVERFFAEYWQRRMLALEIPAAEFAQIKDEVGPLDIARLAGLAKGGTQAWIAGEHVAHSVVPVDAGNAADFFALGATLYFINVPLDRLTSGVADFLGAPRGRVIASIFLTPASGGASCHFDMHENFTVQLTGAKHWNVGDGPVVAGATEGYVLGQQLPLSMAGVAPVKENVPHSAQLRPGSLLYVPRGVLHRTDAGEESWSLNLSYVRTMWLDILQVGLQRRLTQSATWRGMVTGLGGQCSAAAQAQNVFSGLVAELRSLLADERELERLAREFLEKPDNREPARPAIADATRLLMKVPLPTAAENAVAGDPKFGEKLNSLFRELGAQSVFSRKSHDRRIAYALFDIKDPSRIFALAEPVSVWLKVKPEFFPETAGKSYFGDVTLPAKKS